jgi:putative membrane protein
VIRRLLVTWLILAVAIGLTAGLLPGIEIDGGFGSLLLIAAVWGIINTLLGPIARLISLPLTIMTFGLFTIIVNAVLFAITDWLVDSLDVDNFLWSIAAVLLLSVFSFILNRIADRMRRHESRH